MAVAPQMNTRNMAAKQSVHLKIMNQKNKNSSIIPEEYEPYSTGRWSINPHSSIKTNRGFMKIKDDIAKEYNMYQRVEQQKNYANRVVDEKRKRVFQGDHLNEHWAAGSTGEERL